MLSKLLKHRKISHTLTRQFASASQHDGFGDLGRHQERHEDFDVPTFHEVPDISPKKSAKAKLPVLPHFDYTPPKYTGPSYEQIKA